MDDSGGVSKEAIQGSQKMRDKPDYRAANIRAQGADPGPFAGRRRAEVLLQRFLATDAPREPPAAPLTAGLAIALLVLGHDDVSRYPLSFMRSLTVLSREWNR